MNPTARRIAPLAAVAVVGLLVVAACGSGAPVDTPAITPGTSAVPRDVNIVARDYAYVPSTVDLVPGETVVLQVINGGLEIHEAILGDMTAQLAWEAAEAATVGAAAGTHAVRLAAPRLRRHPHRRRLRPAVDVTWTVPSDAAQAASGWFVGCHIPGHWQKGMVVPVRFVDAGRAADRHHAAPAVAIRPPPRSRRHRDGRDASAREARRPAVARWYASGT